MSFDCCCAQAAAPPLRATSTITRADLLARIRFRLGISRMKLVVTPGLYALNDPGPEDPVLVTANFRLSFDALRSALGERPAWILVLDTKGVNVWCAAGKGSFGTDELIYRIRHSNLASTVSHRRLILPQLGAPGIAAHEAEQQTGFRVYYGPVEARDLPAYLDAGMQATAAMRRKEFPLGERLELIPLELMQSWKLWLPLAALSALLSLLLGGLRGVSPLSDATPALLGVAAGAILTPALLPWIPGRSFALKGGIVGVALSLAFLLLFPLGIGRGSFTLAAATAAASFLALNFTGATTFTSPSGVKREMRIALPMQIALLILAIGGRILGELLT